MSTTTYVIPIGTGGGEIELALTYRVTGRYLPATYWEPAEEPELEIEAVTHKGADFSWLLDVVGDELADWCWQHAHEQRMQAQWDAAEDHTMDRWLDQEEAA